MQRNVDAGVQPHGLFGRNEPTLHHDHRVHRAALGLPALTILPLNESVVPIRSWAPRQHWAKGRVNSHDFNLNIKRFRSCQAGEVLEILKAFEGTHGSSQRIDAESAANDKEHHNVRTIKIG
jgi:hypothetical protein